MNVELRYRTMADQCRAEAATLGDAVASAQWLRIADEYDKLAASAAEIERRRHEP
jgi:hypothetical protein